MDSGALVTKDTNRKSHTMRMMMNEYTLMWHKS